MKKIIGYYRKCDLLTMCGTASSFVGMMFLLNQHFTTAVICMIISGLCDAFDGTLARGGKYSKAQQAYGVQLDSLSDVICFGVFPALITSVMSPNIITKIICVFYMLCGVVRLAYFNTLSVTGEGKKGVFIGVPITTVSILYPLIFMILRAINFSLISKVMPVVLLILGIAFIVRIEIPKVNMSKLFGKIFNKYVINYILFPLFIIFSADLFYRLIDNPIMKSLSASVTNLFSYWSITLLLILLIDAIFLIINAIIKNGRITKIILLVICIVLMIISDIKYNIMGIPLEVLDINYLNPDNMAMMGTASGTIGTWITSTIIKAIVISIIGLVFVLLKKDKQMQLVNKKSRLITLIVGVILIVLFAISHANCKKFILKNMYRTTEEELLTYEGVKDIYNDYGFVPGMYVNTLINNENKPEGYKTKTALKLINNAKEQEEKWEKANIVFILSEAFSYLENIDEVKFNKNLTPNIDSYEKEDDIEVLDLLVPTYGGSSVNTEFEILTGGSLALWKTGITPYTQYYNDTNGPLAPNIIKELNNNGYETMYLTPWGETSYKSKYVYSLFGTDKTIYGKDLTGEIKGKWYSDKSLMEDIYNELKETKEGEYKFIMSASAQNHFSYGGNIYNKYDISVTKTSYDKEGTQILKNYAQGIYDADKELNNLYEKIQELDVPTIIVFYGDHLPYTKTETGYDPYTDSKYFNTENEELNKLRKYTTKAVIMSNYDIEIDDLDYINASYLGSYIINKMDLKISNYFKFVDNTREVLPVFNKKTVYMNDKTYNIDNMTEEMKQAINNYKYVQYGSFYEYLK